MAKAKAALLLIDENLYPRHKVDRTHVNHIRSAYRAGNDLPPVVADRVTKKVIDGVHRIQATLAEHGPEAEIAVEWRDYEDEQGMLLDAIKLNSGHGSNLTAFDRVRCVQLAKEFKIGIKDVSRALRMPPDELKSLKLRRMATGSGGIRPIKRSVEHLAGKRITKKQQEGIDKAGGLRQMYYVNEVIRMIEYDLLDKENESLMARLEYLSNLLVGETVAV